MYDKHRCEMQMMERRMESSGAEKGKNLRQILPLFLHELMMQIILKMMRMEMVMSMMIIVAGLNDGEKTCYPHAACKKEMDGFWSHFLFCSCLSFGRRTSSLSSFHKFLRGWWKKKTTSLLLLCERYELAPSSFFNPLIRDPTSTKIR